MAYLTEGDLENYLVQDIDNTFSAWIATVIGMVEAYVDQYCGTDFENSGSTDKYFDGSGTKELVVGELQSVSALTVLDINGTALQSLTEGTDYYLYPLNETIKNKVVLSDGGALAAFPDRIRAVKVTGVFGHSTVPAPIKLAAARLAAHIVNEGLKGGRVSSETLGSYTISYQKIDEDSDVLGIKTILNMYREIRLA